ncbi:MAG: hypothetical protein FWD53_10750 [Phycisphaerales bacterium]|nr:hypothetical protein [Phycisphaerales bacterium]
MSHAKRAILLSTILTLAAPLWAEGGGEPMKVPLTTTTIPEDTFYVPPSMILDRIASEAWQIHLDTENPTKKLTLGGIEHTLRAETPTEPPKDELDGVPVKLILKTPTQEYTVDLSTFDPEKRPKPIELTLDGEGGGRKYLLSAQASAYYRDKKLDFTYGDIMPGGIQSGKIGKTSIALFDANFDGFYTADKDGIIIDSATAISWPGGQKFYFVQPLSKYITTPEGIFEIQNVAKDGSELTVLPYKGATAHIEVNTPQKYFGQIILTSDTGLNVIVGGKAGEAASIIPGSYTLLAAFLTEPVTDGPRHSPMLISGEGMSPLNVGAGAKQVLTLSGPKKLEFQPTLADGKININPKTLLIKGQAGETYKQVPYDHQNPPEVILNIGGKSILLGKMEFG